MSVEEDILVNGIYIPRSEKTGKPSLSENDHTSVFFSESDAKEYAEKHEFTIIGLPEYTDIDTVFRISALAGARVVDVYSLGGPEELKIPYVHSYINQKLTVNLTRLKETQKKEYLYALADCKFIIPCNVENQSDIFYGIAKSKNEAGEETTFLISFTDLDEFYAWSGSKQWKPLEVDFEGLMKAARRKEVIMNLAGNRYLLTKHKIDKIRSYIRQKAEEQREKEEEERVRKIREKEKRERETERTSEPEKDNAEKDKSHSEEPAEAPIEDLIDKDIHQEAEETAEQTGGTDEKPKKGLFGRRKKRRKDEG